MDTTMWLKLIIYWPNFMTKKNFKSKDVAFPVALRKLMLE
jgi:hypothetical protein